MKSAALQSVRGRIDRLANDVKAAVFDGCPGPHRIVSTTFLDGPGTPLPNWPPAGSPDRCRCGYELEYERLVFSWRWED